jgi:hypothetical protein
LKRELTVAAVRGLETADPVEVLFLESTRIYLLPRGHPGFEELLGRLREGARVCITVSPPDGDMIEDVSTASRA